MKAKLNSGTELWKKAKTLIPGGNQLLSKRSERFLPGLWPAYYKKAKGCEVWDMDGRRYFDFTQVGVGACVLGYADKEVNEAVIEAIRNASMCTLNCYEEIELAEVLLSLHPWAQMARFARTGGEACAIAVRIARAATGKTKVAFCGYHGWHDWYLSANLGGSSNLDDQLLPGLAPLGVPKELKDTTFPFQYNRLDELEKIVRDHGREIGVIIMEPVRDEMPKENFLHRVRELADRIGAVLIFDEVTSGFRMNLGGAHLGFGVHPDMVVFGKALGNGFPISAVLGRRSVMDAAQNTFISSTFWTERIGFVAALTTLKAMKKRKTQQKLMRYGELLNEGWQKLSRKHNLPIKISGIPSLTHLSFLVDQPMEAQTLYSQEMLLKGYLVGPSVYLTGAHNEDLIRKFIKDSDATFLKIKKGSDSGTIRKSLKGDVAYAGFKRLA